MGDWRVLAGRRPGLRGSSAQPGASRYALVAMPSRNAASARPPTDTDSATSAAHSPAPETPETVAAQAAAGRLAAADLPGPPGAVEQPRLRLARAQAARRLYLQQCVCIVPATVPAGVRAAMKRSRPWAAATTPSPSATRPPGGGRAHRRVAEAGREGVRGDHRGVPDEVHQGDRVRALPGELHLRGGGVDPPGPREDPPLVPARRRTGLVRRRDAGGGGRRASPAASGSSKRSRKTCTAEPAMTSRCTPQVPDSRGEGLPAE